MQKISCYIILSLLTFAGVSFSAENNWKQLDSGLEFASFKAQTQTAYGDSVINILRIDPGKWDFVLLTASELTQGKSYSARDWCRNYNLTAVINAGMYDVDYIKHIGFLKSGKHLNNSRNHKQYKSIAAFNPVSPKSPPFRIFDEENTPLEQISAQYNSVIENLRLLKSPAVNRWEKQDKRWPEAALGEDNDGKALFIFSRSPYSMYEFNEILLSLPLNIKTAQHLEGGVEAQLYIENGGFKTYLTGGVNPGMLYNSPGYPIPNVIGIKKKV